jgi:hypothetical protein
MYGLPNGWLYPVTDTSDVLNKQKRRKRKTEEQLLEEYLAAQILAGRQAEALAAKQAVEDALTKLDLEKQEKTKRVRYLMMFMLMED